MTNHTGERGPIWSPEEDAHLEELIAAGWTHITIADCLPGRTVAAVGSRAQKLAGAKRSGLHSGAHAQPYQVPTRRPDDDLKHLRGVIGEGGFRWLTDCIAARFYALENAPQNKSWWRTA